MLPPFAAFWIAPRSDGPVVPVFIWAPEEEGDWPPGAASRWWLHHSLASLDAMLRETIRATGYEPHPHHSGHGVGVSFHEEPRLVPYNDMTLAPGMVIAIEPGIYLPGVGGVRLENVVLVTQDGCELLTRHLG